MTTDNRTNEPTDEQVETALDALSRFNEWTDNPRGAMRAALVAAQGAAPQAAALPETGDELRDEDGDLISSGKHLRILQQGMYVCDTCTNSLGLNVRWDHAIKRDDHTPVLPSSGVDEDALAAPLNHKKVAEVAEQAGDEWQTMFDQLLRGRGADPGPLYPFIARALCVAAKRGELS